MHVASGVRRLLQIAHSAGRRQRTAIRRECCTHQHSTARRKLLDHLVRLEVPHANSVITISLDSGTDRGEPATVCGYDQLVNPTVVSGHRRDSLTTGDVP